MTRRHVWGRHLSAILAIVVLSWGVGAGQKKKQKGPDTTGAALPKIPVPVADEIDHDIGEMLGAFQVGDVEAMHKYYADNATFTSGAYEPPIVGWQNYVAAYQRQRAAFQGMQFIRRNTYVFFKGDVAWTSYQWEFASMYQNKPYTARGQTTLVLNKAGDHWLIVHNHTSQICEVPTQPQQPPAQVQPGQAPTAPPKPGQ